MSESDPTKPAPILTPAQQAAAVAAAQAAAQASPEARAQANASAVMAHPEMVPAKFRNADGTVNADALVQSYLALEQKQGGTDPTSQPSAITPPDLSTSGATDPTGLAKSLDAGKENTPQANSLATVLDGPVPVAKEKIWETVQTELRTTNAVSETTLAALKEMGVPDTLVAAAVTGAQAKAASDLTKAHAVCGGEDGLKDDVQWAKDNLSVADLAVTAEGLKGPNALMILQGLHAQATASRAASGQVDTGQAPAPTIPAASGALKPFASVAEQQAAQASKEYKLDPAFRQQVEQRIMLGAGATAAEAAAAPRLVQ